ncbi:kinesin motor domain-containing protein [Cyathus striatus]|nr:kinesin motor domain-containing protein [Cyathus striatus]
MDVSNVYPEQVLVDDQTVEPGDMSFNAEDMVSVRCAFPPPLLPLLTTNDGMICMVPSTNEISLLSAYHESTTPAPTFTFDSILTGSENKPIYIATARKHVRATMEGYNAVVFAYEQTASGKTYTLTGDETEPGVIPRATRDIAYIRNTPEREYLRYSYLEIYNETIIDLLAPPSLASANPVRIQGTGNDITLVPLCEVVTSLVGVNGVLKRGQGNRRTASTDWNERSSRSRSVFRVVIESRERREEEGPVTPVLPSGRHTPGLGGRQTPGLGGARLQARGGRSVRTFVLSLIDLAGSEKATSDKERTREGKYINTRFGVGFVVACRMLTELLWGLWRRMLLEGRQITYLIATRSLRAFLSGNARISVICTINPDPSAVAEITSTLLFAKRVKGVHLNAQKKEMVDTDALIERYRKEIEGLRSVRLMLLFVIVGCRLVSSTKVDFDMSPYQLQQEFLAACMQMESQANQLLLLEAALIARPPLPPAVSESEKDKLIAEQGKTIRGLEIVVRGTRRTWASRCGRSRRALSGIGREV